MPFSIKKPALLALLPVILVVLALAGCKGKDDPGAGQQPPSQPANPPKVRVEFRPPESGEHLRRHIYAPDGVTEVETQIEYADGHMDYLYYRKDGTMQESKETYQGAGTAIKRHTFYAADGTTVTSEDAYRRDGTLESAYKILPDGTKQKTGYRKDGKRLLYVEVENPDSSSTKTYYRQDGKTLWAVFKKPASGDREVEYYGATGQLEHRRLYKSSEYRMEITAYRADGTVAYRQSWKQSYGGWRSMYYTLDWTQEYQADGVTPSRKLVFDYYGRYLREAHAYNADGSKKSSRYFRNYDETLEKEEFYDAAGKVTKTETHTYSEGIKETVDAPLRNGPEFDDPSDPNKVIDD